MPLTGRTAAEAMKGGVVFGCASCGHYHDAKDKGLQDCGKMGSCGSPLRGRAFDEYVGPVVEFCLVCWVCGEDAKIGLHLVQGKRTLGACEEHKNVHNGEFGSQFVLLIP